MRDKAVKWIIWTGILAGILFGVSILSLCVGPVGISIGKIISLFAGGQGTVEHSIIFDIRLPRILLALAVGGALSVAGVVLQGMFRNPLVEPYTLGISGGASLGVCLGIVLRIRNNFGILSLPVSGFLGAGLVILLVYFVCTRKGLLKVQWLLLSGVMISFICTSLVMFILAISRSEDLQGIIFWIMGSLGEPNKGFIYSVLGISVLGLFVSYLFCLELNALALGEEEALHLGINTEKTKRILFILASVLTGLSVSAAGIIGFVGLAVPHFVRMFAGSDHRIILPGSFLSGGAFLIFCDTLARTVISPSELPVGVITGILGGIVFIYVLLKKQFVL